MTSPTPSRAVLAIIRSSPITRYAVSAAVTGASVALRMSLDPIWGPRLPFITLFPAVMLSAWLGGLGPGLMATTVSTLAAAYFWIEPARSLAVPDTADALGLVMFAAVGVVFSVLNEGWRRTAAAALDSEERLRVTLASIGDAVIVTDAQGRVTSINAVAQQMTGWTAVDGIGRPVTDVLVLLDERSRRPAPHPVERAIREGIVTEMANHTVLLTKDHREVPIDDSAAPVMTTDGQIVGAIVVFRDVSERRRAEQRRHADDRAARELAAIVASSDDAIVSKNLNSEILSWNGAAERMFGYSADEAIGRSVRIIIPQERQGEEDEVLARLRRGERVEHFETVRRRKDGREIAVSLTISPIYDADGVVVGASKIARDISALKEMEAERMRLAAETVAITEQLNRVGAAVASDLDRDKVVQTVTDVATELTTAEFGAFFYNVTNDQGEAYTLYTISGVPREHFSAFPMPRNTAVFEPTFRGTSVVRSDDITSDPRYGHNPPYHGMPAGHLPVRSYLAVPVLGRTGAPLGGLFFGHSGVGRFTDRHERLAVGVASWASVALENAAMYDTAQEASRLKDHFLATLSHELRTPLNAILGWARMLQSGMVAQEKRTRAIQVIERNATSLTQIVEDVLDVSRIVSGKLRLNVQTVQPPEVLRSAVDAVLPAADAKGIRVETVLDPVATPIAGDPERLQQVFWNLLSNAVKFTPRGGKIQVRLAKVDSHIEVTVTDTGIGIAPEFLPHIFERFRQADAGISRERGGLGLGLSIARQLVEMHGGTIHAISEGSGRGSTFTIEIPVMIVHSAPTSSAQSQSHLSAGRASLPNLSDLVVLAVDDDRDASHLVCEILEAAGARVLAAGSATEALQILEKELPNVLIADLGMPQIDGLEFIGRVRTHHDPRIRDVPAAALTAFARSEDRTKALGAGFHVHLAKPIDPAELITTVAMLGRHFLAAPPSAD